MTGGILGAFASLDLFYFYFFHELALVPTFIMIGVWGRGADKNYATFQITLYLSLGALDRADRPAGALSATPAGARLRHCAAHRTWCGTTPDSAADAEPHLSAAAVRLWHSGLVVAVSTPGHRWVTVPRRRPRRCYTRAF